MTQFTAYLYEIPIIYLAAILLVLSAKLLVLINVYEKLTPKKTPKLTPKTTPKMILKITFLYEHKTAPETLSKVTENRDQKIIKK